MLISRRAAVVSALAAPFVGKSMAAETSTVRFGFQKGDPVLMTAKAGGDFAKGFEAKGVKVEWIEFQFGPPMLEAMRVGSVDLGIVGDTPPIFAQAAKGDLMYVAAARGAPQSLLLPPGSPLQTIQDLKGRKVAFGRGSSAHNFLLMVLEKAGLRYEEIQPVLLGPADAGAAFSQGAVEAWSIWEPYASLYNNRPGVRTLTTNREIGEQFSYVMANGNFVRNNPILTGAVVQAMAGVAEQARAKREDVAALLANATGISQDVWSRALNRHPLEIMRLTEGFTASQQKVADRFRAQGLIPVDIKVADSFWRPTA
ncbi:MAG: aliphatic sulfonate ABC transporter substrate-binding protein [Acetobacteraceae bacterium]